MADSPHPEQGFRTGLGVLARTKSYGATRRDAACRRGLTIRARSVPWTSEILKSGLDRAFIVDRSRLHPAAHQYPLTRLLPLTRRRQISPPANSERLSADGRAGMARALDEQRRSDSTFEALGFEDGTGRLVDHEATERHTKRLAARLKFAALWQTASV